MAQTCVKETRIDLGKSVVSASQCVNEVHTPVECRSREFPYNARSRFTLVSEQRTLVVVEDTCQQKVLHTEELKSPVREVHESRSRYCYGGPTLAREQFTYVESQCKIAREEFVEP